MQSKPRVFIGSLHVVPRTGLKPFLDEQRLFRAPPPDAVLLTTLREIFTLPSAEGVESPMATDLGLDIAITGFQRGEGGLLSTDAVGLPVFWRPKLTLESRLYHLESGETKATFRVTKTMVWSAYLSRLMTFRAFLRFRPLFDDEDLEALLVTASAALLEKLKQVV